MSNTLNQLVLVPEHSSTEQNESANIFLPPSPPPSPLPSNSLRYHYITEEESSFSPDPYGIVMDSSNMLLSPISSHLPILTLPTTRFNKNTVHHQPSSGGDGVSATVITDLSPPPLSVEGTSSAAAAADVVVPSQPSAAVDTVTEAPSSPLLPAPNNTSTGDATVIVAAPPMAEDEHQIAAPLLPFPFPSEGTAQQASDQNPLEALMIMVKRNEDIIKSLGQFAKKKGFFILGASGVVSYVELLNQQEVPVEKTTLQGTFEIISLDGIVVPKNNGKDQANWLTVLVAGKDSRVRGGTARRLIAGSNVQIVVGTISPCMEYSLARQQYLRRPELLHFPNYRNRDWLTTEVVNQIHKVTLEELNNETTNTPSARKKILA